MEQFGLSGSELTQIILLVGALLIGLFLLRILFRVTAAVLRLGCLAIGVVAVVFVLFALLN